MALTGTPIGTDDISLSLAAYLRETPHLVKAGSGFVTQTLAEAHPDLEILHWGLDYGLDDRGPKIGIHLPDDRPEEFFFQGLHMHQWQVFLDVDAMVRDADGHTDRPATTLALARLRSSLSLLLTEGQGIPLSIWGEDGPFQNAGVITFHRPDPHATGHGTLVLSGLLRKVLQG